MRFEQSFSLSSAINSLSLSQGWALSQVSLCQFSRVTKKAKTLVADSNIRIRTAALSPDGQTVAYQVADSPIDSQDGKVQKMATFGYDVILLNLATGKKTVVAGQRPEEQGKNLMDNPGGLSWSPDGKRLAYSTLKFQFGEPILVSLQVDVCKRDGTGRQTVFSTNPSEPYSSYSGISWR